MNDELLNILSDNNPEFDNQKLIDYVSDKLSAEDKHEFEKTMADSALLNDIVEGLQNVKNKKQLHVLVEQLNGNLKKQLDKKKTIRNKRKIKDMLIIYLSIILILIIIVIGFFVIKKHLESEKTTPSLPAKKEISFKVCKVTNMLQTNLT